MLVCFAALGAAAVRPPAAAGSFYPADPGELAFQVDKFLNNVPAATAESELVALIAPHAGYPYSGQTAAYAYKRLAGRHFKTVVLIGASHYASFDRLALPDDEAWETPLGRVPVDREFVRKLAGLSGRFVIDDKPHLKEHALEVQLPFLQRTLKDFKIVPVLFGSLSLANCQTLAYALSLLADDNTLIVISTDWSHYYDDKVARRLDGRGLGLVADGDLSGFIKALSEGDTEACGAPAVITGLLLAPALGANQTELAKYNNSGDLTGDRGRVVGYAAVLFACRETALSAGEKGKLLKIARRTVTAAARKKALPRFEPEEPALNERRGAFVTLKKYGELRGCIGCLLPVRPLFRAVQEMAREAALNDRRFYPVNASELPALSIEISVLSRLRRVADAADIKIGRDGLYIIKGDKSGLLLPQVAAEQGWGREEFLRQVCYKANLPGDAWREPEAALYRFSAGVFGDDRPVN